MKPQPSQSAATTLGLRPPVLCPDSRVCGGRVARWPLACQTSTVAFVSCCEGWHVPLVRRDGVPPSGDSAPTYAKRTRRCRIVNLQDSSTWESGLVSDSRLKDHPAERFGPSTSPVEASGCSCSRGVLRQLARGANTLCGHRPPRRARARSRPRHRHRPPYRRCVHRFAGIRVPAADQAAEASPTSTVLRGGPADAEIRRFLTGDESTVLDTNMGRRAQKRSAPLGAGCSGEYVSGTER